MSSILTNPGAMVALQTLKGVNNDLSTTQNQISTGMKVSNAKDNAATFAISQVMRSDVEGFRAISESLSLGESTVAVARQASETVTDLLTEMKGKIVAAQEENVDRAKIQTDINQLRDQIDSVVSSAQFNGLNLVDGSSANPVNVLSSLDRSADGAVSSSNIAVATQNFTQEAAVFDDTATDDAAFETETGDGNVADGANQDVGFSSGTNTEAVAGDGFKITLSGVAIDGDDVDLIVVAQGGETEEDIANAFLDQVTEAQNRGELSEDFTFTLNGAGDAVNIANDTGEQLVVALDNNNSEENQEAGGLARLADMDVTTNEGAEQALADIESQIQFAIDGSAAFGSAQGRIEIQNDFVGTLTDSLNMGIGTLVDADMEETSARLQALQVQQQLATQSLGIANAAPQNLLALFG